MKKEQDTTEGRCRAFLPENFTVYYTSSAILASILLLLSIPPAFNSCTSCPEVQHDTTSECSIQIHVRSDGLPVSVESAEIFFFNDDRLRKLDSYQHVDGFEETVESASREGQKIIAVLANSRVSDETIQNITSYDDLQAIYADLSEDDPEKPVMYGECSISAGHERSCILEVAPLLAKIRINSLCCDFYGHTYSGKPLKDVKIYLTNVSCRYPVAGLSGSAPESYINAGQLNEADMSRLSIPGMILYEHDHDIDDSVTYPEINLYCYPNEAEAESPGTPFTRLVIEGTIDGIRTWYPININRDDWMSGDTPGVSRNTEYVYDITLTRRGVSDPDTPISLRSLECVCTVSPWNRKEDRIITY